MNFLNSKPFFGTESLEESQKILETLNKANIRCSIRTFHDPQKFSTYPGDPFHLYSKHYLENLSEFHIIRVHRTDYRKALEIYYDY